MGQQNDKVLFEGHRDMRQKRRQIFNREKAERPVEICEVPGCHCSLPHPQFNTKICSSCQVDPPPFLKTKYQPKYYEQQVQFSQPKQPFQSRMKQVQVLQSESIPSNIGYYNAWSLPSQKYLLKQRPAFNSERKSSEGDRFFSSISENNREHVDYFMQEVTQQISKAIDVPKMEFERRKQNMNLAD